MSKKLKIAFLGSRGIPRCYSGFETFVEEVSVRLAAMGHDVTVYNRLPFNTFQGDEFKGVKIVKIPTLAAKGTDTLVHSALCTLHTLKSKYDVIYYCGVGSSVFSLPAKMRGGTVFVNVDGADWERAKWGSIGKTWLRWSEMMAAKFADCVIADHPIIKDRYKRQFGIDCALISYGAEVVETDPGIAALVKFSLNRQNYFLYVSRLTPENGADLVMEAYLSSGAEIPLVVVGDAPYVSEYLQRLRSLADKSNGRILMTGYQFGDAYRQLGYHAKAYIFPTTIEATRPVLLEQMGMGSCIIARDTPANRYILDDTVVWFDDAGPTESLATRLREVGTAEFPSKEYGAKARNRVAIAYSWDAVAEQYVSLFDRLCESN